MSSAAAGLFAFHPPQIFSLLLWVFVVGVCLVGTLIALSLYSRERGSARALFYNRGFRRFPVGREAKNGASDFSMPLTAARETPYTRGQFQGRRKSFAR
jgi:hypothetical protein